MDSKRERVIAGDIAMVANELRTVSPESLQRIYRDVGATRWRNLTKVLVTATDEKQRGM